MAAWESVRQLAGCSCPLVQVALQKLGRREGAGQRHGNGGGQVESSPNDRDPHEQSADDNERHERGGRKHGIARIDRMGRQSDAALDRAHVEASTCSRSRADQAERHCPCSGGQTEDGEREPTCQRDGEVLVSVANGLPQLNQTEGGQN